MNTYPIPVRQAPMMRALIALAILAFPAVFSVWSFKTYGHADLSVIIPTRSDEVDYWQECRSFERAGFHSGYFTLDESTPVLGFSPYGWHGPVFPMLVGSLARIWGSVPLNAAMPFNLAWLTACLAAFLLLVRPGVRHLCRLFFFLAGLAGLYWYMPSFFQEPYHCGIAFVLAGLFLRLYVVENRAFWFWAVFFLLFGAAYLRVSWAVFFFPLMISVFPSSRKGRVLAIAASFASMAAAYMLYQYTTAPFSLGVGRNYALDFLLGKTSLTHTVWLFIELAIEQVQEYISGFQLVGNTELLLIVAWFFFATLLLLWKKRYHSDDPYNKGVLDQVFWMHLLGLGGLLFLEIVYYGIEPRVLVPHFIVSFVVLMHFLEHSFLQTAFIIFQIAIFPIAFQHYPDRIHSLANNVTERERLLDFERFIKPMIAYKPNGNRWCNTVLIGQLGWPVEIMGFEPGLGTSFYSGNKDKTISTNNMKSRYFIAVDDSQVAALQKNDAFQFIAHTALGDLYLNKRCKCY